ncbi:MAG: NAD(P)-binding protein [Paucibacter sp.]|nr:NAD(P)-binding protein [Roseateles sp.]
MPSASPDRRARRLGLDVDITRRDFVGGALWASGAALTTLAAPGHALASGRDDWTGPGGVGDYANANGNTWNVVQAGHVLRDSPDDVEAAARDTGERFDCVVVGGGISGLAAALHFMAHAGPGKTCLLLDNHPMPGGEAKHNEFEVDGQRLFAQQASALFFPPLPHSRLGRFYDAIGLAPPRLRYQVWAGPDPAMNLARTPYDAEGIEHGQYGFFFPGQGARADRWVRDPIRRRFADAPVDAGTRRMLSDWFSGAAQSRAGFVGPQIEGDAVARRLDAISLEQHYIDTFGLTREFVRKYLVPEEGGGSGLGPDALSAYSDYAADLLHGADGGDEAQQMFPGGNSTIARLMLGTLVTSAFDGAVTPDAVLSQPIRRAELDRAGQPARVRLGATVLAVRHDGKAGQAHEVRVSYERAGQREQVRAGCVVMAGGSWTTRHVVRDLPESHRAAYAQFHRSPALVVNVAVRQWRFLYERGLSGCRWFGGPGHHLNVRAQALVGPVAPSLGPDSPTVLSLKMLFPQPGLGTAEQGQRGRAELFATPFSAIEARVRELFARMFDGPHFDVRRDIAGIIVNRWGHAYLSPQPGFFFGKNGDPAPRDILRAGPFGRIAFANTDLAGIMDHRCSILEAQRAVDQLFDSGAA